MDITSFKMERMSIKNMVKSCIQILLPHVFMFKILQDNKVSLTFDDGPHATYTEKLLTILEQYGIRCTFFLVGQSVEKYPEIVHSIYTRGHTIGLHTYSHMTLDSMTQTQFVEEVRLSQDIIEKVTGMRPRILRPPKGQLKFVNLIWAKKYNITLVHYTITSNDWKAKSTIDIIDAIKSKKLRGGEIISFHDTNPYTIDAMPVILDDLLTTQYDIIPIL